MHSIGKWDGDTLVVDTIGYTDQSWIGIYPHTEMLHDTERIRALISVISRSPSPSKTRYVQHAVASELELGAHACGRSVAYVCENNKAEHLPGR